MESRQNRTVGGRLVLLAPPGASLPANFRNIQTNSTAHTELLRGLQKLRGKLYLEDGAVQASELHSDGSHRVSSDAEAWHVLALTEHGEVCGCSRYLSHPNSVSFAHLAVRNAAIASSREWGGVFRNAVSEAVQQARFRGLAFVEVGGWALAEQMRRTREALRIALATYSLARMLGGCVGITTATRRHHSADILRGIGGESLHTNSVDLPPYYDPQYRCDMEVLRFDSTRPNPRYEKWVDDLCAYWETAPVVVPHAPAMLPSVAVSVPNFAPQPGWRFVPGLAHAVQ